MRLLSLLVISVLLCATSLTPHAKWLFDVETGMVANGSNDVAVPNETGTRFSLSDDLDADYTSFIRFRAGYLINDRHYVGALVAPLRLNAYGRFERDISFNGTEFPGGSVVDSKYRFDSYRLTYRYQLIRTPGFKLGVGGTIKLRDMEITLSGDRETSTKTNTGPVPLLNFALRWNFTKRLSLLIEGDALAAPRGRAEDVFLGIGFRIGPDMSLKGGYRVLEGGVDVDEIYNFVLIHYAAIGMLISI